MTKNFAHRGFSGKYPENTLLAFSKAIEEGVDGIENDVHLTKDGVLVVMHDELVDRTTNGKGYIKDKTYEELAQLDASYIFKEYGPQKVPTLREYLELVKDTDIITNIELKTGVFEYTGIEQKVYDMLREFDMMDRIIRRKMLPIVAIFLCCVIPQAVRMADGMYTDRVSIAFYILWVILIVLYVYLIARSTAGFVRLRKKYEMEK